MPRYVTPEDDRGDQYDAAPYDPGGPLAYGHATQPRPLGRGARLALWWLFPARPPLPLRIALLILGVLAVLDVFFGLAGLGVLNGAPNEPVRSGFALGAGIVQLGLVNVLVRTGTRIARFGLVVTGLVNMVVAIPLVVLVLPPLVLAYLPVCTRWMVRQRDRDRPASGTARR